MGFSLLGLLDDLGGVGQSGGFRGHLARGGRRAADDGRGQALRRRRPRHRRRRRRHRGAFARPARRRRRPRRPRRQPRQPPRPGARDGSRRRRRAPSPSSPSPPASAPSSPDRRSSSAPASGSSSPTCASAACSATPAPTPSAPPSVSASCWPARPGIRLAALVVRRRPQPRQRGRVVHEGDRPDPAAALPRPARPLEPDSVRITGSGPVRRVGCRSRDETHLRDGWCGFLVGQGSHRFLPRSPAQGAGPAGDDAEARPVHQRRPGHDEPVRARRGVRHRRRWRDRPRPRALRALHRRAPEPRLERDDGFDLLGGPRRRTARRLPRQDRAGDPAHHRRDQATPAPAHRRRGRRRHHRDRRHRRRHRDPARSSRRSGSSGSTSGGRTSATSTSPSSRSSARRASRRRSRRSTR